MLKKQIISTNQQRSKDWLSPWQINETQSFDLQHIKNIVLQPRKPKNKSKKIKLKLKNTKNNKLSLSGRTEENNMESFLKNLIQSSKESLFNSKVTKKCIDFNQNSKPIMRNSPELYSKFQIQEKSLSSNIIRMSCNTNRKLVRKCSTQNDNTIKCKNYRKSTGVHQDQKQRLNFIRPRCVTVDK